MFSKRTYLLFILIPFLQACVKDKPAEPEKSLVALGGNNQVLIIDEGNYGWSNAGISLYDAEAGAVSVDLYEQQNNNEALGDVCQSAIRYGNNYYLVVNNSHKIVVVSAADFKKQTVITGLNSPRYLLPVSYNKAYVSDLHANSIQVLDLSSNTIVSSIPCPGATEQMAMIYDKVFVTNTKSNYAYVIHAPTNTITDSIQVGKGAESLVFDKNDKLWILSGGDSDNGVDGKLSRVDPVTLQTELSLPFASGQSPWRLCINKTRDTLYYINAGVFRMPVQNGQLPASAWIAQGSGVFYGLGVNPNDYHVYVSDALDYTQRSKILVYNVQGNQVASFNAGLISNGFVFE